MSDAVVERVKADVEARAIEMHAEGAWAKLSPNARARYRLLAASDLAPSGMRSGGWFADRDLDMDERTNWQPVLELANGTVVSSQIWFNTEVECEEFIRTEMVTVAARMTGI